MNRHNSKILLAIFALMVASCTGSADPTTTSAAETTTTSEVETTTPPPTSTTTVNGREIGIVSCDEVGDDLAIVCEAFDLIGDRYVDDIEEEALVAAATEGLSELDGADSTELLLCVTPTVGFAEVCEVAAAEADDSSEAAEAMVAGFARFALDPNSGYLDSQALDLLQEEQQGQIEGIGALVSPEDETIPGDNKQCGLISETCRILIVSTITGAPAEDAGLQRDDVIVAVDGESILGWTVDEVTSSVRGPAGSDVTLTIQRVDESFDVTITRAAVVIPVIEQDIFGNTGYVRLRGFNATAGDQFVDAVSDVLEAGVDELVIDLRDNPGGFLDTAIEVTSVFIGDGDVVVTQGPDESIDYPVSGAVIVPEDIPVIFVVNKGSASASEVVSATLQERGRVTVVGENTFGKNTVQQRFGLSNGGALKLTVARWLTPGGLDFGGTGVTPDVLLDVGGLSAEELVAVVTQ